MERLNTSNNQWVVTHALHVWCLECSTRTNKWVINSTLIHHSLQRTQHIWWSQRKTRWVWVHHTLHIDTPLTATHPTYIWPLTATHPTYIWIQCNTHCMYDGFSTTHATYEWATYSTHTHTLHIHTPLTATHMMTSARNTLYMSLYCSDVALSVAVHANMHCNVYTHSVHQGNNEFGRTLHIGCFQRSTRINEWVTNST